MPRCPVDLDIATGDALCGYVPWRGSVCHVSTINSCGSITKNGDDRNNARTSSGEFVIRDSCRPYVTI